MEMRPFLVCLIIESVSKEFNVGVKWSKRCSRLVVLQTGTEAFQGNRCQSARLLRRRRGILWGWASSGDGEDGRCHKACRGLVGGKKEEPECGDANVEIGKGQKAV